MTQVEARAAEVELALQITWRASVQAPPNVHGCVNGVTLVTLRPPGSRFGRRGWWAWFFDRTKGVGALEPVVPLPAGHRTLAEAKRYAVTVLLDRARSETSADAAIV